MHAIRDRSTILAGLADELRPLLQPLGGALGDLCSGVGNSEAAELSLETAFMIRAAGEMLELQVLEEAGRLLEEVVPLLNGAPYALLRDALPVVQSAMTTLEQATEELVDGGNDSPAELGSARTGLARLRARHEQLMAERRESDLDLEAMLATLPDFEPLALAAPVDLEPYSAAAPAPELATIEPEALETSLDEDGTTAGDSAAVPAVSWETAPSPPVEIWPEPQVPAGNGLEHPAPGEVKDEESLHWPETETTWQPAEAFVVAEPVAPAEPEPPAEAIVEEQVALTEPERSAESEAISPAEAIVEEPVALTEPELLADGEAVLPAEAIVEELVTAAEPEPLVEGEAALLAEAEVAAPEKAIEAETGSDAAAPARPRRARGRRSGTRRQPSKKSGTGGRSRTRTKAPVEPVVELSEEQMEAVWSVTDEPELTAAATDGESVMDELEPGAAATDAEPEEASRAPRELPEELRSMPEVDAEILEVFNEEANEALGEIKAHLETIQADPTDRKAGTELRRACHTLKGAANVVGLPSIGMTCKALEDLLDALADAGLSADERMLQFVATGVRLVERLVENPAEPSLLQEAVEFESDGCELTLNIGVVPPASGQVDDSPAAAAWARAVDNFLADEVVAVDGPSETVLGIEGSTAPAEPAPVEAVPAVMADQRVPPADEQDDEFVQAPTPELLSIFAEEAEEHLASLSGAALRLDANPRDSDAVLEARRALHTLKGSAGALTLETIGGLCHEAETRLDQEAPENAALLLYDTAEAVEQVIRNLLRTGREGDATLPEASFLPEPSFAVPDVDAASQAPVPAPELVAEGETSAAGSVRVDLARVDDLLNQVGEVVLTRAGLEQRLERMSGLSEELRLTVARLRQVAQYIEDRYEVAELIRSAPSEPAYGEFDELEMDRYTELHRISREVTELAADAETTSDEVDLSLKELDGLIARQGRLDSELQDGLMATRLVAFSTLSTRLQRTARGVALRQGKQLDLVVLGAEIQLDKRVIEELSDALLHLIRNAVDHGLESPAERQEKGKPAAGSLRLQAFREGSEVVIQLEDDGRGIDIQHLRRRAEVAGLLSAERPLDDAELVDLIFEPGLSTAVEATNISGRGVGLDVVRSTMTRLKGSVSVRSASGLGTTFTLRVPVVLAVLQTMLVRVGEQSYAIPIAALERVVKTSVRPEATIGQTPMLELDGEAFMYVDLGQALGQPPAARSAGETPMLVVRAADTRIALAVSELQGQREIVVKSLGPHLRAAPAVLGATVQTNGQVLLVLNTTELLTQRFLAAGAQHPGARKLGEGQLSALVVDDSLSVRKVVARSLERDGWVVRQARDGVDALEVLQSFRPDVTLVDIEMPRMDGFELTSILRDVPDYGSPPVVMITSRAGDKHRARAQELGVAGYVVKPYQEHELLALLHQVAAVRN